MSIWNEEESKDKSNKLEYDKICRECNIKFKGKRNSVYCSECAKERKKQSDKDRRKRLTWRGIILGRDGKPQEHKLSRSNQFTRDTWKLIMQLDDSIECQRLYGEYKTELGKIKYRKNARHREIEQMEEEGILTKEEGKQLWFKEDNYFEQERMNVKTAQSMITDWSNYLKNEERLEGIYMGGTKNLPYTITTELEGYNLSENITDETKETSKSDIVEKQSKRKKNIESISGRFSLLQDDISKGDKRLQTILFDNPDKLMMKTTLELKEQELENRYKKTLIKRDNKRIYWKWRYDLDEKE